jgi:hypothetical protein
LTWKPGFLRQLEISDFEFFNSKSEISKGQELHRTYHLCFKAGISSFKATIFPRNPGALLAKTA